jgi:dipeptidyl aminopeptidase/acylaminoacyl peptidase
VRDLTPLPGISAQIDLVSPSRPQEVLVMLNDRDVRWFDAWIIDIATGDRELAWTNTQGFEALGFDWLYRPRWGRVSDPKGGSRYQDLTSGQPEPWLHVPYADEISTYATQFNMANTHVHMVSSVGRNTSALLRIDWQTKAEELIAQHPQADIQQYLAGQATGEVLAVLADPLRGDWFHIAEELRPDFALLRQQLGGFEIAVNSQSTDDSHWTVIAHKAEQPATYFHFDRRQGSVTEICRARPALRHAKLAPMQSFDGLSRDGRRLPCYLTLPLEVSGERPEKPLPMVLVVHGGPWGRDSYGYNRAHQWLANRGYAVLSANYRGSTGFGKAFVEAATREHGRKMFEDLLDMVEWAIRQGIADRSKVAIYGASYGGYSSFLGATFAPDVFCCSIPVVGISNLQTLLENMPPYWAGFADFMFASYGDPRTDEGRALLAERSPIHKVGQVSKPLLIFHGLNDVRCKVAESESFVAAMQAKNIPGLFVVFPDEGHGVHLPGNAIAETAITEAFLARHLGGQLEPMGDDLTNSSYEVRAGRDIFDSLIS